MIKLALSALAVVLLGVVSLVVFQSQTTQTPLAQEVEPEPSLEISDATTTQEATETREQDSARPQLDVAELPAPVPDVVPAPVVNFAPAFNLPRIDGQPGTISLADYRGQKPVIIDFFAPHCPNCRRNIVTEKQLYERFKDQVEIIIIAIDPEPANSEYFAKNPVAMPVVYDATGQVLRDYGIRFTNTHALINKDGSLYDIVYDDLREDYINYLLER